MIKKEKNELNIVITTERSLQPHLINKNLLIENKLDLKKGVQIEIQELANKLILLGYTKDNVTSTEGFWSRSCLLYTSPSPRDTPISRMPSSA